EIPNRVAATNEWGDQTMAPPPGMKLLRTLRGASSICRISWSPDGRMLAAPMRDGTVALWDVEEEKVTRVLRGHREVVYAAAWSSDGRTVASGSWDCSVRLWDVESGQQRALLDSEGSVNALAWHPARLLA